MLSAARLKSIKCFFMSPLQRSTSPGYSTIHSSRSAQALGLCSAGRSWSYPSVPSALTLQPQALHGDSSPEQRGGLWNSHGKRDPICPSVTCVQSPLQLQTPSGQHQMGPAKKGHKMTEWPKPNTDKETSNRNLHCLLRRWHSTLGVPNEQFKAPLSSLPKCGSTKMSFSNQTGK